MAEPFTLYQAAGLRPVFPVPVEYSSPHGDGQDYLTTAAINFGTSGVPVFPCLNSEDKRPLTANGFKDATTDANQIEAWWRKWPTALIGLPMGNASGLFVIDIDVKHGNNGLETLAALEKEHGPLPETLTVRTWSGGEHRYFIYPRDIDLTKYKPLGNSSGRLGRGIDTRGEGGYVIVPPSQINGKFYEYINFGVKPAPLPAWVLKILLRPLDDEKPTEPARPFNPIDYAHGGTKYGLKALENIVEKMAAAPKGERNVTLFQSAVRLGALVAGGELLDHVVGALKHAAAQTGLKEDEINASFKSGYEYGLKHPAKAPETPLKGRGRPPLQLVHPKGQGTGTDGPAPDPDARTDKPTQDQMALVVFERFGQLIRYNHTDGFWYVFTGHIWERDETGLVFNWIRRVVRDHNPEGSKDLGKSATTKGVETFCRCDERLAVKSKYFNMDDFTLGLPDGALELETGTIRPGRPEDLISLSAGTNPASTENCPTWFWFLKHATKRDMEYISFLKRLCGYFLAGGNPEQIFIIIYGPGGTGKSLFLTILRAMMGDYAQVGDLSLFMEKESNERGYALARMTWVRLVTGAETKPGQSLNTAFIKAITGEGTLPARPIYGRPFDLTIKFVPVMSSNYRPTLRYVDSGMIRRILICLFDHKPENPDSELELKLKNELPGILRWAVNGYLEYRRDGLKPPATIKASTRQYFESEDVFGQWLAEKYIDIPDGQELASDLLTSWNSFRDEQGFDSKKKHSAKMLSNLLDARGYRGKHTRSGKVYFGLRRRRDG